MTSPRLRLKDGVTPQAAASVLRKAADDGSGVTPSAGQSVARLVNAYLQWVETTEQHLRWMSPQPELAGMLHTERYWRIREISEGSVRPFPLVDAETAAQTDALRSLAVELEERVARLSMVTGHLTILDTHVLLHYLPPEQIDWPRVVGQTEIRLVVPLRVIEELDKKKYTAKPKLADRARRLLPQLHAVMGTGGSPGRLRDGVTIEVPIDSRSRHSDADQEILDTCHELALISGTQVALVTGDTGMALRAEAQDIHVVGLPEELLRNPPDRSDGDVPVQ